MSKSATDAPKNQAPAEQKGGALTPKGRALFATDTVTQASLTCGHYSKGFGELDTATMMEAVQARCGEVTGGDLGHMEAVLAAQAMSLDIIFNQLARRAAGASLLTQMDGLLRLALKAQSQCRTTIEAISLLKNPQPVAFVRQANITSGPQQVNNAAVSTSRGKKTKNARNELLNSRQEIAHEKNERLDFGAAGAAGRADSPVEAVAGIHRSQDDRR